MKTEYAKVFAAAAASKVVKSNALGMKTTWTTEDHHRAMAECVANVIPPENTEASVAYYEVIADTYNVSAFGQWLEKKFAGTGHFVRRDGKKQTVSELDAEMDRQIAALTTPPKAPAPEPTPEA